MKQKSKSQDEKTAGTRKKKSSMNDLRKPSTSIGPAEEEFRIISPDVREPEGQTTHE